MTIADITSVEDLFTVLMGEQDDVRDAMFRAGDALVYALTQRKAWGYPSNKAFLEYVGGKMGKSKRALDYRISTAKAFPPADRDIPVAWDIYRAAAGTDNPLYWVARAADEALSAAKLRTVYKQVAGREPDEIRVAWPLRNADARMVAANPQARRVTFEFAEGVDLSQLSGAWGQMSLSVASVQEVAQEAA